MGKQLAEKRRNIFWTVCSSHCICLKLEKFETMSPIKEVTSKAKIITKFIYSRETVLKLVSKHVSERSLVNSTRIRSVRPSLTLENIIVLEKENLQKMFGSSAWKGASTPNNTIDALDKLRFLCVTEPSLFGDVGELEIRIKPDPENGTITITDTGVGMTKEELIDCLGMIAQSGTSKFLKALKKNKKLGADNGLIGQFGVRFYSAFFIADKVSVLTKSPRSDKQYIWEAVADSSSYVIKEETDLDKMLRRGTQITLHLRVEEEEVKEGEEEKPEGEMKKKKKNVTEKYWDLELGKETKTIR
ncbi:hypothetical protein GIB67_012307, partial [Kingdonia uniflora]